MVMIINKINKTFTLSVFTEKVVYKCLCRVVCMIHICIYLNTHMYVYKHMHIYDILYLQS